MKNCFMWKHHGHTVPCHFGCTDVCQIGVSRANNRDSGPFLENFVASLNPVAWYRYGAGITVTGAGVSEWRDQTTNARHLLQGTDGNRPALQSDSSILFDGVDNYLSTAAFTLAQPVTWYLLFKSITHTNSDPIAQSITGTHAVLQGGVSARIAANAGGSSVLNDNLPLDTYGVYAAVFDGAASLSQVNNTTPTTASAGTNGIDGGIRLGANGTPNTFGHVQFKEVILFPAAHDAGQRAKVIAYLAQVGNLTI